MGFNVGDEVKAKVKGTVVAVSDHHACLKIQDGDGCHHYVYPDGAARIKKVVASEFDDGLWMDNDGEMVIRQDDVWYSLSGESGRHVSAAMLKRLKPVTLPYDAQPW